MSLANLLGPPAPCSGCGAMLAWQVARHEDRFIWADANGDTVVSNGLPHPLEVAKDIGDRIMAATTGPKRKRGPMPSDEECNFYAIVAANPIALGAPHLHRHDQHPAYGSTHSAADVAWHCGEPMHLRPSGWHCRVVRCGVVLELVP